MPKLTEKQEDVLFEKFREERQKEVDSLKAPQKDAAKKMLTGMLRDRLPAKQSSFQRKKGKEGEKQSGVSAGYIATESETGDTFILKHFYKSKAIAETQSSQAEDDRQDAVRELLGSTMYQLLLYDRAPKEELVIPDKENPDYLYLRSKFFTNVTTFSEFSGSPDIGYVGSSSKLKTLEGFEKANAACDLLREIDYHGGNLMVQDGRTVTKIDHGRSFIAEYTDFSSMAKERHETFSKCGYTKAIKDGNLSFSVEKYSQALNQMLQQYDEQQIEAIIDQKFDELKKAGFDPTKTIVFPIGQDGRFANSFDELKQFYKEQIRDNITIMRDIAQSTEIISKFTGVHEGFRNGGWLEEFAKSEIKDPVAYAAHHNIKIEGQNALEWAYNNNYKIKIPAPHTEDVITEARWKKVDGKWLPKKSIVFRTSIGSQSLDPLEYITRTKKQNGLELSKSEEEFLVRATELYLTDGSGKTLTSISASYGFTPNQEATARVHSQDQENTNILVNLVDSFVKESTKEKVTAEKVTRFYDKFLSKLEKQGYLTKQDVANIKKDPDYEKQAKETAALINAKTPDLEAKEKMYYKVARFTKAIGLSGISKHFTRKMNDKQLEKIHVIETVLSHNIKIDDISKSTKPMLQSKRLEKVRTSIQEKLKDRRGR